MTVQTTLTYPKSTTSTGEVNSAILKQEIADASPSVSVGSVYTQGTDVVIVMEGNATAADETLIDGVVAAHEGAAFASTFQRVAQGSSPIEATSSTDVLAVELDSGPLPAGDYEVDWYGEVYIDDEAEDIRARARIRTGTNGGGTVVRGIGLKQLDQPDSFAGKYPHNNLNDGESIQATVHIQMIGTGTGTASVERGRIFLRRVDI